MGREIRRSRGPQYLNYRCISIHVIMNQGSIEDRDDTILGGDGADIYASFRVSMTSQATRPIYSQYEKQKGFWLAKNLSIRNWVQNFKGVLKCTYDRMAKTQLRNRRLSTPRDSI